MEIKLTAKLAAYTKVTNINQFPEPTSSDIGGFVGVGSDGHYIIFKNVNENKIDELFEGNGDEQITSNNKSFIDSLF